MSLQPSHVSHHQLIDVASLTPAQREKAKTPVQRAEDLIYVVTHTVTCLSCDVLFPVIGAYLSKLREAGKAVEQESMFGHFKKWYRAELFGDFGAVLPTIALQRYAPRFVALEDRAMGKVFGPLYRMGANRATDKWAAEEGVTKYNPDYLKIRERHYHEQKKPLEWALAPLYRLEASWAADREVKKHHVAKYSDAYRDHTNRIYGDEEKHFGQMLNWTVLASAGNIAWQQFVEKNSATAAEIIKDKVKAGVIASAIVMGSRAAFPIESQKRDQFMGKHVVVPLTKFVGKPFGIDGEAVEVANENRTGHGKSRKPQEGVPGRVVKDAPQVSERVAPIPQIAASEGVAL